MLFSESRRTDFSATRRTKSRRKNDTMMALMAEESQDIMCDAMMFQCWHTFLPSNSPTFIDLTDPPKSVRFQLDQNTEHILPQVPPDESPNLYISEAEQEATKLEMCDTVTYFRYAFMLETRPKDYTPTIKKPGEVSTIGLEWRIWPDGRFERRQDIQGVVLDDFAVFGGTAASLAKSCEPISKVSELLARKRAERVVKDLALGESPKPKQDVTRTYDLGRWMGIHSWMQNIPLLRQE